MGEEITGVMFGRSFFERLAFRPKDAKKPGTLLEKEGASERKEDGVVMVVLEELVLERAGGLRRELAASEGYGSGGSDPGEAISRYWP